MQIITVDGTALQANSFEKDNTYALRYNNAGTL